MGILSRFTQPDSGKLHSSGLADANDGSARAIGAMRHESFEQRIRTERNRRHIEAYKYSAVAQREQTIAPDEKKKRIVIPKRDAPTFERPTHQQGNAEMISHPSIHKANFSEPQSRGYNPYR